MCFCDLLDIFNIMFDEVNHLVSDILLFPCQIGNISSVANANKIVINKLIIFYGLFHETIN